MEVNKWGVRMTLARLRALERNAKLRKVVGGNEAVLAARIHKDKVVGTDTRRRNKRRRVKNGKDCKEERGSVVRVDFPLAMSNV